MRSLRQMVGRCYQQALNEHRAEEGAYFFTMQVASKGDVTNVEGHAQGSLSPATTTCMVEAMRTTHFTAPEGPHATVRGLFELSPQPAGASPPAVP